MKNLLLITAIGVACWALYRLSNTPATSATPVVTKEQPIIEQPIKDKPLPFPFKLKTKRLLDEYKRCLVAGGIDAVPEVNRKQMRAEVIDLRKDLQEEGLFDQKSLVNWMTRAALELGYKPDQADQLISGILSNF